MIWCPFGANGALTLSGFMRCVNEHIARRANAAHGGTGRCWALQITGMEYTGCPGIRCTACMVRGGWNGVSGGRRGGTAHLTQRAKNRRTA